MNIARMLKESEEDNSKTAEESTDKESKHKKEKTYVPADNVNAMRRNRTFDLAIISRLLKPSELPWLMQYQRRFLKFSAGEILKGR